METERVRKEKRKRERERTSQLLLILSKRVDCAMYLRGITLGNAC